MYGGFVMANEISLTVRLPHDLNQKLTKIAKEIGMTKTNLIRSAIHDFLTANQTNLDFSENYIGKRDRLVLNVNQITYNILEATCNQYNQSMNAVITVVSYLALERSSKWLQATQK